jgi:hypothetical protein
MSKRLVIFLWLVALALGGAVYAVKSQQNARTRSSVKRAGGQTLFEKFPASEVASLAIGGPDGNVHVVKKDGKWTVAERDGYPANPATIHDLLRTVEQLKVVGGIEAGPAYAARFGMDETSAKPEERGTTVTFTDAAGKELAKLSVGKTIGDEAATNPLTGGGAAGRFVRNHADASGIYKTSEMFASLSGDPKRWLAEDFIQVQKPVAVTVTRPGSDEPAWKLTREHEEEEFALEGAKPDEKLDPAAFAPFKSLFSFARFADVVSADEVAKRAEPDQKRSAVIGTVEGFTYTLGITPAKPAEKKADAQGPDEKTYFLTVKVDAALPKERKKTADEKPEDAKTHDDAFAQRLKELQDKLAQEKAFEGRTFEVTQWTLDALLKDRAAFLKKDAPAAPAGRPVAPGAMPMGLPPGFTPAR